MTEEKICPKCDNKMTPIWTTTGCYMLIGHRCDKCEYKEMLDPLNPTKIAENIKTICPSCDSDKITVHPPEIFYMFGEKNGYGICLNCSRSFGFDDNMNPSLRPWQTKIAIICLCKQADG